MNTRRVGAIALLCLVAIPLAASLAWPKAASPESSTYDDGPQGSTAAAARFRAAGFAVANIQSDLRLLTEIKPDRPTLLLLLGPRTPIDSTERGHLEKFVEQGGRVLVADEEDSTGLAERFGITFSGLPIQDTDFVGATDFVAFRFTFEGGTVPGVARTASRLFVTEETPGEVVAWSQTSSFLDLNQNGALDADDQGGPFPVAFRTPINSRGGFCLFVADADFLANAAVDALPDAAAPSNLASELIPAGGTILFDERGKQATWVSRPAGAIRFASAAVANMPFIVGIGAIATWALIRGLRSAPTPFPTHHEFRPNEPALSPATLAALLATTPSDQTPTPNPPAQPTDPEMRP